MVLGKIESRSIKWGLAQGAMLISFFSYYIQKSSIQVKLMEALYDGNIVPFMNLLTGIGSHFTNSTY